MSIASRLNCLVFTLNSYVRNNHNVILSRKFTNTHVINVLLYNSQLKLFFLRVFISYLQSNQKQLFSWHGITNHRELSLSLCLLSLMQSGCTSVDLETIRTNRKLLRRVYYHVVPTYDRDPMIYNSHYILAWLAVIHRLTLRRDTPKNTNILRVTPGVQYFYSNEQQTGRQPIGW